MDGQSLLVGEQRRLTRTAVLVAAFLFLIAMIVDYITLSSVIAGRDPGAFSDLRYTFRMQDSQRLESAPLTWIYGYLLVAGLAGTYAYFNVGYLTSLLLALSPNVGTALWSIYGFDEYMILTPLLVFERVFPEGPFVATLGFLLGVGLRIIMQPAPAHHSPDVSNR